MYFGTSCSCFLCYCDILLPVKCLFFHLLCVTPKTHDDDARHPGRRGFSNSIQRCLFFCSISQVTRFYKFLWNEMADSKQKITEKLHALPFVFVPNQNGSRQNDLISGIFLSHNDVYWNDSAGVLDEIKEISSQISGVVESLRRKTLCNIYPGLHDFFVNGCGVPETPSFQEYLKILGQFAHYVSPSCAAKAVSYLLQNKSLSSCLSSIYILLC